MGKMMTMLGGAIVTCSTAQAEFFFQSEAKVLTVGSIVERDKEWG